jgi:hypothetical protein
VLTAARQFNASGMGVDIDADLVRQSNASARKSGVASRVEFVQEDVFKTDLGRASVLTLYLLPAMMLNLRAKLFNELKPGTRIVSHDYHLGDWAPDDSISLDVPEKEGITGVPRATVMLWHVPARAAGTWEVKTAGGESYQVTFKQRFQTLDGVAAANGKAIKPRAVTLRGNDIAFVLPNPNGMASFNGRINGEAMQGSVEMPGAKSAQPWTATRTVRANVILE